MTDNSDSEKENNNKKKGFTALRNNIFDRWMELDKDLSPLENSVLKFVIYRTIKWKRKTRRVELEKIIEFTGKSKPYIYNTLRSLHQKKIIVWEKEKYGVSYFGLNEECFGRLLWIRKKKPEAIVDNSESHVDNSKTCIAPQSISSCPTIHHELPANSSCIAPQSILEHKSPESLMNSAPKDILKDTLKDNFKESAPGSGESFSLLGSGNGSRGPKPGAKTEEDAQNEKQRQLKEFKEKEAKRANANT